MPPEKCYKTKNVRTRCAPTMIGERLLFYRRVCANKVRDKSKFEIAGETTPPLQKSISNSVGEAFCLPRNAIKQKRTHTVRPYEVCANINFISHSERKRNFVEGALASRYKIEEQGDEGIYKGILITFLIKVTFYLHMKHFFELERLPKLHYRSLCKQRF